MLAENPRAIIGGNNPPPDADLLFIDARIVERGAQYLQFLFPKHGLDSMLAKRKCGAALGFRRILCNALRGTVGVESLGIILDLNRKTVSEDMQSVDVWCENDDVFAEIMDHIRAAILGTVQIDADCFFDLLAAHMAGEPERRREEKARRALIAADKRELARKLMDATKAKAKGDLTKLKQALGDIPKAEAILALHTGARPIARDLTVNAIAVLEMLMVREAELADTRKKVARRRLRSELDARGVNECIRLGLAREAIPFGAKDADPPIGLTPFGTKCYLEALSMGRIEKPRRAK